VQRRASGTSPGDRATFDLLASDAMMRLGTHLRQGAVRPELVEKDAALVPRPIDALGIALEAATAPDLAAYLDGLAPQSAVYRGLMESLAAYREIAAAGGWPVVPVKGPALKPGAVDAAIPAVRARLAATGEYAGTAPPEAEAKQYDEALAAAVKEFQGRHGLAADGVIGAPTRAALARPVRDRIGQLQANLERLRWFPDDPGRRYVAVHVPTFELVVVEDGSPVLTMPVVVGRKDRRTPVLQSEITELVFNPSWTVPPTLLREDFLPKMRRNQGYAARRGLKVVGKMTLQQPPGPRNPLGRVKFYMPNGFAVYLHDTTAKGLMRQSQRAFSSGCVRLGDAIALANRLLADDPRWTPAARRSYLSGWTTRHLALREPVPVYLKYQTAWRDTGGDLQFRDDLYGRDAVLSQALAGDRGTPASRAASLAGSPPG
jgi:murein L,D-transpeptidase YcbB/YkuD